MMALPPCWHLGDSSGEFVYHRHLDNGYKQAKLVSAEVVRGWSGVSWRKNLSSRHLDGKNGEVVTDASVKRLTCQTQQTIPNSETQFVHLEGLVSNCGINENCRGLFWNLSLGDECDAECANPVLETCLSQFPNIEVLEVMVTGRKTSLEIDLSVFKQLKNLKRLAVVGNRIMFVNMPQLNELTYLEYLRIGSDYASMVYEDNYFLCGLALVRSLDALRLNALKELDMRGCYLLHHESLVNLQGLRVLHAPTFFRASSLPTSVKVLDISSSVRCRWFGSGINSVSEDMKPFQNLETVIAGRWENDLELPSDWVLTDKLPSDSRIRSVYRRQPGGSVRSSRIRPRPRNERVDNGK